MSAGEASCEGAEGDSPLLEKKLEASHSGPESLVTMASRHVELLKTLHVQKLTS